MNKINKMIFLLWLCVCVSSSAFAMSDQQFLAKVRAEIPGFDETIKEPDWRYYVNHWDIDGIAIKDALYEADIARDWQLMAGIFDLYRLNQANAKTHGISFAHQLALSRLAQRQNDMLRQSRAAAPEAGPATEATSRAAALQTAAENRADNAAPRAGARQIPQRNGAHGLSLVFVLALTLVAANVYGNCSLVRRIGFSSRGRFLWACAMLTIPVFGVWLFSKTHWPNRARK
ncbi:hypothetical protein [Burkholderia sp. Ac-20379]|uniref:hypothetical protein n=1 Tax=Burkholderia sp. Ac-20379 TaxID=2703900 RepID=UPI00197EB100|nr:hypothetical protein [Burkholderia sp. Ac-20379]MBN3728702.1 hypothetical protein [Burkholderia sp. Ac-20379]